jgi:hypothetical protein
MAAHLMLAAIRGLTNMIKRLLVLGADVIMTD